MKFRVCRLPLRAEAVFFRRFAAEPVNMSGEKIFPVRFGCSSFERFDFVLPCKNGEFAPAEFPEQFFGCGFYEEPIFSDREVLPAPRAQARRRCSARRTQGCGVCARRCIVLSSPRRSESQSRQLLLAQDLMRFSSPSVQSIIRESISASAVSAVRCANFLKIASSAKYCRSLST